MTDLINYYTKRLARDLINGLSINEYRECHDYRRFEFNVNFDHMQNIQTYGIDLHDISMFSTKLSVPDMITDNRHVNVPNGIYIKNVKLRYRYTQ